MDSFTYANQGGRANNEDAVGERRFPGGGVFVVCDGLGGHAEGEVASEAVRRTILAEIPPENAGPDWLRNRLEQANDVILELQNSHQNDMKSTVVALLIQDGAAHWGHVGDSRLYHVHNGTLAACTEDHSAAYEKYKAGEITREQLPFDEGQNHLTRCVGSSKDHQADLGSATAEPGDGFLLCSDGLWEYLQDDEIAEDLRNSATAQEWAEKLLARARSRFTPGNDNYTLITVRI